MLVYPSYVGFIHRFCNFESFTKTQAGGFLAGFKEDRPVEDYEYSKGRIHLKLHDIYIHLADDSQLLAYLIFMLRANMKRVEVHDNQTITLDDEFWLLDIRNTLTEDSLKSKIQMQNYKGVIFTWQPDMSIQKCLLKHTIEYISIQEIGSNLNRNHCDELLHLYIREHLSELEVEKSKATSFIKGNVLIDRLKKCTRGKEFWREYEIIGKEIFDYLFSEDFLNYGTEAQSTTSDGVCRRDLIINNTPVDSNSIWSIVQKRYNSMLIVVDFKNYKESLNSTNFYEPTKYLNRQTGMFGIIFTREDLGESAKKEQLRLLRSEEKVLLCLSDNDLLSMLEEKKTGRSVTRRINDKYFSLIKKI